MLADPLREILKVAERLSVARDEVALAVLDVGEGAEAVDLQFENKLVGIERLNAAGKPYGTHPAWKHALSINGQGSGFCQVDPMNSPIFHSFNTLHFGSRLALWQ